MVSVTSIYLALVFSVAAISQATVLQNKYCREYAGLSRCVDDPLMVEDEDLWCPYRECKPSYIPAEECPANKEEQATHKCKTETVEYKAHYCVEGRVHKMVKTPIDCEKTNSCTGEARVCACLPRDIKKDVLSPDFEIKPICEKLE